MALITYNDKVALNENPSVADINKVKAGDMNEIKSAVNTIALNEQSNSTEKTYSCDYVNNINTNIHTLGTASNEQKTITLTNKKISDYKFLIVSSGYGYAKSVTTIPVALFSTMGTSYQQCRQYVKTYNGNDFTYIKYSSDTSFIIYSSVGTDVVTTVYGIK